MKIVFCGLTITSSWGNGHATTYRSLLRALAGRGHEVWFCERDTEWYAHNRDLPTPAFCRTVIYDGLSTLDRAAGDAVRAADLVVVGSYVPEGRAVIDWVSHTTHGLTAFYDIDTPVTLSRLAALDYLDRRQIPTFDVYFSFTGGPILDRLRRDFGARRPVPLYCSVDPAHYLPAPDPQRGIHYACGYLGTYSADRQPALDRLLLEPARRWLTGRFIVAGPQYPDSIQWPANVTRVTHLDPSQHRTFYNDLAFTVNVTRRDMVAAGYSPSVRLFEAAACATPVISDNWPGLAAFFTPGAEILVAESADDALGWLCGLEEDERYAIGQRARRRVLHSHSADHRAIEFERAVTAAGGPAPLEPVPAGRSGPPEER